MGHGCQVLSTKSRQHRVKSSLSSHRPTSQGAESFVNGNPFLESVKCITPPNGHVRLSAVSIMGVHPIGGAERDVSQKFTGKGGQKSGINKLIGYTKYGQLIIRKIIKISATRYHILRLKCTINSIPDIFPFVCNMWSLTQNAPSLPIVARAHFWQPEL